MSYTVTKLSTPNESVKNNNVTQVQMNVNTTINTHSEMSESERLLYEKEEHDFFITMGATQTNDGYFEFTPFKLSELLNNDNKYEKCHITSIHLQEYSVRNNRDFNAPIYMHIQDSSSKEGHKFGKIKAKEHKNVFAVIQPTFICKINEKYGEKVLYDLHHPLSEEQIEKISKAIHFKTYCSLEHKGLNISTRTIISSKDSLWGLFSSFKNVVHWENDLYAMDTEFYNQVLSSFIRVTSNMHKTIDLNKLQIKLDVSSDPENVPGDMKVDFMLKLEIVKFHTHTKPAEHNKIND